MASASCATATGAGRLSRDEHTSRGGTRRAPDARSRPALSAWPPPPRRRTSSPHAAQLTALAQHAPLALAGAGATPQIAAAVGARLMAGDPVTEAERAGWLR